jgi:hypothetical protein
MLHYVDSFNDVFSKKDAEMTYFFDFFCSPLLNFTLDLTTLICVFLRR